MKQNKGICVFLCMGILVFVLIGSVLFKEYKINEIQESREQITSQLAETIQTEEVIESMTSAENYEYQIIIKDHHLAVIYVATQETYFDTGIREEDIPEEVKNQIIKGFYLKNEKELYDFLESYSS